MSILVMCHGYGQEFEQDRRVIVADSWRLCPDCRNGDATQAQTCPIRSRWLKSGAHRNGCPDRRRWCR